MSHDLQRGFRLGENIVRPLEGCIERPEGPTHVPPKTMAVLVFLAGRAGEIVERREIIAELWEGRPADVALTRTISELRHALDDHHDHPRIIRTVRRRGYQIIAPVRAAAETGIGREAFGSSGEFPSGLVQLLVSLRRRRVFRAVGGYAIGAWLVLQVADIILPQLPFPEWTMTALIVLIGFGFPITVLLAWKLQLTDSGIVVDYGMQASGHRDSSIHLHVVDYVIMGILLLIATVAIPSFLPDQGGIETTRAARYSLRLSSIGGVAVHPNSLAVLPFAVTDTGRPREALGAGLAGDLRRYLASLRPLRVASAEASRYFSAAAPENVEIARRMMVRYVLAGTIDTEGDTLRIAVWLTDAASGQQLFSEVYPRRPAEMLSVRGDALRRIVRSLTYGSLAPARQRIIASPTSSGEAYLHYLLGLADLGGSESDEDLGRAQVHFERAIDLDPEYGEAYLGLCESRLARYRRHPVPDILSGIEEVCTEALHAERYLSRAHVALGTLHDLTGNSVLAEADFHRAIALNPLNELGFRGLAELYRTEGRRREAEIMLEACIELQPADWRAHLALGEFYLDAGRPEKAIDPLRRVTSLNPEHGDGMTALAAAYFETGDRDRAEQAFRESGRLSSAGDTYRRFGTRYYRSGRFAVAAELFRRAIDLTPDDYLVWGLLASATRFLPDGVPDSRRSFLTAVRLAGDHLEADPDDAITLVHMASYYANLGQVEQALSAMERALRHGPDDPYAQYCAARVNALLGRLSQALDALERAADLGYAMDGIARDPDLKPLRAEPRFLALAR